MQDSSAKDETFSSGGVKDYLTCKETARAINRSYPTTLRLIKENKILGAQHGSEWQVKKLEVRRFLEQGNHPDWKKDKPND